MWIYIVAWAESSLAQASIKWNTSSSHRVQAEDIYTPQKHPTLTDKPLPPNYS